MPNNRDEIDDAALAVTKDALYFLHENGCISFGVLPGAAAGPAKEVASSATCRQPAGASWHEGDEEDQASEGSKASGKEHQSGGSGSSSDESEGKSSNEPKSD
uniref:Uncharacterized protein n=1 Tax=Tetradesmus obliquus TaxID=3088 RepID=A0A383VHP7_TETOB|eukprot:jgi/Sobl393_1/12938/SZX65048.1